MRRVWGCVVMVMLGLVGSVSGTVVNLTWDYTLHSSLTMAEMRDFVFEVAPTATGTFTELSRRAAVVGGAFDVTETVDVTLPRCFRVYATAQPLVGGLLTSAMSNVLCQDVPQINAPVNLRLQ